MSIDPFENPKTQIARAKRRIDELTRGIGEYFAVNPFKESIRRDRERGVQVAARHYSEFPEELSEMVDDSITKSRSALDQAVYAASLLIDPSLKGNEKAERGLAFPFADDPKKLDFKSVPAALHDVIRRFEPYPPSQERPGGNFKLVGLNRLANIHKHRFLIKAQPAPASLFAWSIVPVDLTASPTYAWDPDKRELSATTPLNAPGMHIVMLNQAIAFSEPEFVRNANVVSVLTDIHKMAEGIVGAIEAEARRLLP
ncbi:hypothetical protein IVA87_08000 [Bradyrhizobium sp. 147]|uniref:hypothetical protein n=1 Tax=Bradyrhizobium sp. 147 TaxID=2782623 RepID=UPI001FF94038|nr:hypothetical protein [Bradyrhizobium sp. 147]MCK1679402.1 hypothetical protein [Bradyrhizobium sp. 147]